MMLIKITVLLFFHLNALAFPKACKYLLGEIATPNLSAEAWQMAEVRSYFGTEGFINSEAFRWSLALAFHENHDADTLFDRAIENLGPYPRSNKAVLNNYRNIAQQVSKLKLDSIKRRIVGELFREFYSENKETMQYFLDLIYKKEPSWIGQGMNYAALGAFSLLPFLPIIGMAFDPRSAGQAFGPVMGFMAISGAFGAWAGYYALQEINGNRERIRTFPSILPDESRFHAMIPQLKEVKQPSLKPDSVYSAETVAYFKVSKRWPVRMEILTPVILIMNSTPDVWLAVSAADFDSALRFRNALDLFLFNQKDLSDTSNSNSVKGKARVGNSDTLKKYSGSKLSVLITPEFKQSLIDKDAHTQRQMLREYLLKELD